MCGSSHIANEPCPIHLARLYHLSLRAAHPFLSSVISPNLYSSFTYAFIFYAVLRLNFVNLANLRNSNWIPARVRALTARWICNCKSWLYLIVLTTWTLHRLIVMYVVCGIHPWRGGHFGRYLRNQWNKDAPGVLQSVVFTQYIIHSYYTGFSNWTPAHSPWMSLSPVYPVLTTVSGTIVDL